MKIQLDWNLLQVSELTIIHPLEKIGVAMKCQTTLKNSRQIVDTIISQESFLVIQQMLKQGFSQLQIRQEIYEKLKVSSLGETLTIRDRIKGGGCGSSSVRHVNDAAVIQQQLEKTQKKNKEKEQSKECFDVKKLSNQMQEIIDIPESQIFNGRAYLIDTIIGVINQDGAISNSALHPQLLKILMKGFNLLLRVLVKVASRPTWTLDDKKNMERVINNILLRIKLIEKFEPMLIHCFCLTMIRDILNTQKSTFDPLTEAINLGVPLFGLLWSQDLTLLLQLALKAKDMILEKLTQNTMQSMMRFQSQALVNLDKQKDSENESKNTRLLFAYQQTLDSVIGKTKQESWEVQVFAMMQINETLKQMIDGKEQIKDFSDKWNQFFIKPEMGLIQMCKQQSSFASILFIKLLDTYLFNHKTIRFMTLQILIHALKLLSLNKEDKEEKEKQKQIIRKQIIDTLFQRWLRETAPQVRTLFLEEDMLIVISERIKSQENDKQSEASNEQNQILEDDKKEKEALQHLKTLTEGQYQDPEVKKELQDISDILVCIGQKDGIKEVIKLRQIEQWKAGILKRRAKGDIQKDDALLDTIECYVGQFIKKKVFEKMDSSEGNEKQHQEKQENYHKEKQKNSGKDKSNVEMEALEIDSYERNEKYHSEEQENSEEDKSRVEMEALEVDSYEGKEKYYQEKQNNSQEGQETEIEKSSEKIEALDYLLNQLIEKKEKSKMCVIVGSGGRGKSMLLKKLELELLEDSQKENGISKYDTIPIIIKLFELDPKNPNIVEYLLNQPIFQEQRLDPSVMKSSKQQKVLLLDAYDEFRGPEFNLWETLMLEDWVNTTVVVTCRDDTLTYNSCNRIFSTPHSTKDIPSFTIHELMGFGEEQLEKLAESLLKKEKNHLELFQEIIHGNQQLMMLLSLPINALIFVRTIPSLTESSAQTLNLTNQSELQQLFYSYAFEREAQMVFNSASEISLIPLVISEYFSLFQRISMAMFSRKSSELTQEDCNKAKYFSLQPSLKKKLSATQSKALSAALKKYSNRSILVLNEEKQTVRFVHLSIFEFFVARSIVDDFDSLPSKSLHKLTLKQIQNLSISSRYIVERGDSFGLAILQKIAKMIKSTIISADFLRSIQSPSLTDHPNYTQLILLSRKENLGRQIDTASSNMLSILAYTKCSLVGLNLSRCSLTKAYLYEYKGCIDLSGADLCEAMLTGCGLDLSQSKTEKSQFHDAQSIWQSNDIYSFSSCCLVLNSNPGDLTLATGSFTGFFNLFSIDLNFQQQAYPASNLSYDSQFSWKLIKSKRHCSREKILNIKQINNTYIFSQIGNIVQLDGNGDTILFTLIAHNQQIVSLNYHPILNHLVTVGQQGEIKIWNVADSFKNINTFENVDSGRVKFAQFSSAEPYYLVSASDDKKCGVWQYSLDKKNWKFSYFITGFEGVVEQVQFSGTGGSQLLLTGQTLQEGFALWRLYLDKAELVKQLDNIKGYFSLFSLSPDGKILLVVENGFNSHIQQNQIKVYGDMRDEKVQQLFNFNLYQFNDIRNVSFSEDSKFIVVVTQHSCTIRSVDNDYQEITNVLAHSDDIHNLAITKSGFVLVTVSNKECCFWMRQTDNNNNNNNNNNTSYYLAGRIVLYKEKNCFSKMSISDPIGNGENQYLAFSTRTNPRIQIYEIGVNKSTLQVEQKQSLQIQDNQDINSLQFYESVLFLGHKDGCIAWDSQKQFNVIAEIKAKQKVKSAVLMKNNGLFFPILATQRNSLEVWEFENGSRAECIKQIHVGDNLFQSINVLASSPDNRYLAVRQFDGICKIFSFQNDFSLVATLKSNEKETFHNIVFSADSLRLATTSQERKIKIWQVNSNFRQERDFPEDINTDDHEVNYLDRSNNSLVLFHPQDSKKLITYHYQHIVLWDFQSTYPIDIAIKAHHDSVFQLACSPSGQYIVTVCSDYSFKVWLCAHPLILGESNFELCFTIQADFLWFIQISSISFISENSFACGCYNSVRIFQIIGQNVNLVQTLLEDGGQVNSIHSAETSSKKQYIASRSNENYCLIYVAQNEQQASLPTRSSPSNYQLLKRIYFETPKSSACVVAFSPQAKYFAVGMRNGSIRLYDSSTEGFNFIITLQNNSEDEVNCLCFSSNNLTLACSNDHACLIWDIQTKKILQELKEVVYTVTSVDYAKDGSNQLIFSTKGTSLKIYKQTPEGLQLAECKESTHGGSILSAKFLGSSEILATVSQDKTCKLFQTSHLFQTMLKQQLGSPHSKPIFIITFSSDGKCIAMASEDGTCSLWKITENNKLEHCQTFKLSVNSLSLLRDKTSTSHSIKLLSISDDKQVRLYQAQSINESMNEISKLTLPFKPISKFALQSSNTTHSLVVLQSGNCVILNHLGENLQIQQTFSDVKLAAVNSTSTLFSLLKNDGLQILDSSLNILKTIPLDSQIQNNYVSLTISTDDLFIVLIDFYQNITLFSAASPYEQIQNTNKYPMSLLVSNMTNRSQQNSYQILSTCFHQNESSPGLLLHTDLIAFLPNKSCLRLKASKEASFTIVADQNNVSLYVPENICNIQTL